MAYQTGTYTTPSNLLSTLSTFAQSNGWTLNDYSAEGDGYRLHIQNGSMYFNFLSFDTGPSQTRIALNGSTGYNAGNDALDQPGSIGGGYIGGAIYDLGSTSQTYHMFAHEDSITVFAEGTDRWKQMSFGATSLGYPFYASGGAYNEYAFSYTSYFLKYSPEGITNRRAHSVYINGAWTDGLSPDGTFRPCVHYTMDDYASSPYMCEPLIIMSRNQLRGNTYLAPTHMSMYDYSNAKDIYIGNIPGLYIFDATKYIDEDEITYGADTFVVSKQNPTAATSDEANLGVACLKD